MIKLKNILAMACMGLLVGCASTDSSSSGTDRYSDATLTSSNAAPATSSASTYRKDDVVADAEEFFGDGAEGLAELLDELFAKHGEPTATIKGEEGGGALVVGLRYGQGVMRHASGDVRTVYWKGPSIGFDAGGEAAKVFILVYGLHDVERVFQRFPGVSGSVTFVGGVGANLHGGDGITLAPVRMGVGWRLGASVGYLHVHRSPDGFPF